MFSFYPKNFHVELMKTAIFSDYQLEGMFALQISEIEDVTPILICEIDDCFGDRFVPLIRDLRVLRQSRLDSSRTLAAYSVDNKTAYQNIWRNSGIEEAIAIYSLSGISKLDKVLDVLKRSIEGIDTIKRITQLANWCYTLVYGGGADEYHAVFRSEAPELTSKLWKDIQRKQDDFDHVMQINRI
jgi:hypothetical protein